MTIKLDRAKQVLANFAHQRILVVGDLMLDRYIYGSVSRISPEAPVPVVHVTREKSMPGGASNVAWNIRSLGAKAAVCGAVGRDAAGAELKKLLVDGGVAVDGAIETDEARTTVKTRVIAERQQVVRVDLEDGFELTGKSMESFCEHVAAEVKKSSGVIIEDYGKGLVRQPLIDTVLDAARKAKIPVGLDPKDNQELNFHGITVATPNRKEAFAMADVKEAPVHANPLEDPMLANIAPEECVAYMSSAGMATPDAKSGNQTEQLLAEPEVRQMAAEIERAVRAGLKHKLRRGSLPPGVRMDSGWNCTP